MSSKLAKDQDSISYQALLDKNRALLEENHSLQNEANSLKDEVQSLKARLEEAEELKRAISEGDLDALVIPGPERELIFTLESADRAYRVLVETMNEGTVTLACDGIILYSNRRFAELMRMPSQAIVGTSIYRFIAPENAATFKALLKQEKGEGEISLQAEGGKLLPVYLSISSLKTEGSPNAWCLVVTDLTEQKKNEEILAVERLARSIIEQAAEAIVVCDNSGKIIRFSNSMLKLCGYNPIFQKFENLIDVRFSEGANAGESIRPVSSALKGSTILGEEATFELKDCRQKFHLLLNSGPLKNDNGDIIGCVVTLTDITERRNTEEKLQHAYSRLRTIFDHKINGIGIVIVNANGDVLEANDYYLRILGFSREELEAGFVRWLDATPPEWLSADEKAISEFRKHGVCTPYEKEYIRRDGSRIPVLIAGSMFPGDRGEILGLVLDITERKMAEEMLQTILQRFYMILSNMHGAILLVSEKGRIEFANDIFCQYFNLSERPADLVGITASEMIKKIYSSYSDPDWAVARINEIVEKGEPVIGEEVGLTDGRTCIRDFISLSIGGKPYGRLWYHIDITERKKAENALKKAHDNLEEKVKERTTELEKAYNSLKGSEKSLAEAQKLAHLGNWEWNTITDKLYGSDEAYRIFGISPKEREITYNSFLNYVHPEDREYVDKAVKEALKGKPFDIEYRIVSGSGEERIVHAQSEIIFNEENIPVRMKGTVQDITERKKAEEALAKMEKIRLKEIHHRIKNNLQVISSLLDLQAETFSHLEVCETPEVIEAFKESQNRIASMALIHEELYRGNKIDTLDFAAYLRKLTADLLSSHNLGNKDISFNLDLEKVNLGMDTAIPLGIIVNELVSNSFKHAFPAKSGGEIKISLRKAENSAIARNGILGPDRDFTEENSFNYILKVSDNGKGIPEEIDFQNVDSLGLQLVNILVEQMDGSIELRRDQGTEFIIWFNNMGE